MVEDDGAEVATVVVGNEVLSGVRALQTACSDTLMLQEGLVQSKQHLRKERHTARQKRCCYFVHLQTQFFSGLKSMRGICHKEEYTEPAFPALIL